ncbi:hypothetical protein BJY04DRAFT_202946 [Aspergillus karnatakaensis]|uniref:uncharacterized protein n=1 Tax=Aspergillus karnatakaensis TaxID=1810916 RepID=UPI003CCE4ACC
MLHTDFPHARIMIFGYRSDWKGRQASDVTSAEVANRLLDSLRRARKEFQHRPIIFVAHCVGGLVLARALVNAYNDELHCNRWRRIYSSTLGIVFMGTPFRGAHGALANGEIFASAQKQMERLDDEHERREALVTKRILEILAPGNEGLFSLMSDFMSIRIDLSPQMLCLYETQPARVWKIININRDKEVLVPRDCATLDRVDSLLMGTDHFSLNKFKGRTEEYRLLVSRLKHFVSEESYGVYYSERRFKMMRLNPLFANTDLDVYDRITAPGADLGFKYYSRSARTLQSQLTLKRYSHSDHYGSDHHARMRYMNVQMQVERQQPVYFMDAVGRVTPFHLEFIRSLEAFITVLKENLRDYGPAAQMIEQGEFALFDAGTGRDIDLTRKWDTTFRPGQAIAMCMVFRRVGKPGNLCPSCKTDCPGSLKTHVQCFICGVIFRTMDSTLPIERVSLTSLSDKYSVGALWPEPWSREEFERPDSLGTIIYQHDQGVNEVISLFRNIRIMASPAIKQSLRVWCSVEAWKAGKRSGWCFVESDDMISLETQEVEGLVLFMRQLSPKDDFVWHYDSSPPMFSWREYRDLGSWRFKFKSREDLQIIWDSIRCRPDLRIDSTMRKHHVPVFPDVYAAPLHGTEGVNWALDSGNEDRWLGGPWRF